MIKITNLFLGTALILVGCNVTENIVDPVGPEDPGPIDEPIDHHETVINVKNTAKLIPETEHDSIKVLFELETINNTGFARYLGGLSPSYNISAAIRIGNKSNGLYAFDCMEKTHLALVLEINGIYKLIQTKEELRAFYAPIDSPEEALSIVHLEHGGLPSHQFEGTEYHEEIKNIEHIKKHEKGYEVTLLVHDACRHGELSKVTYLIDVTGDVNEISRQVIELENNNH